MKEMKITVLKKHLKEIGYVHKKGTNISIEVKYKIYESYSEKHKKQSKNKFCKYLKEFGISRTVIKKIIQIGDKNNPKSLTFKFWELYEKNNYKKRYKNTTRTKKIEQLEEKQVKYIQNLRENEPNKGYKLFENGLLIPENKEKYEKIFGKESIISKRTFYDVIEKYNIEHRITKRHKIGLLAEHKKNNTLETYLAQMHHIYCGYKALHRWQVDIKYLTDIPNYVKLGLFDIYLYEITFRDYKTGLTMCYFGDDRNKSSVFIAFEMFKKMMNNVGIELKDITFQFDGGAEFSNIRINGVKGSLIEMIERDFGGYNLINRKEQNGHVESFHRRIEEDLFDTKNISNLKEKVEQKKITKQNLKKEILKLLNKYMLNFNNYWYSSYKPRYEVFGKKSPINIVKEDWNNKIESKKIDISYLEKYAGAYDISKAYNLVRIQDYSSIVNSKLMIIENKVDLAVKNIRLISDNYLSQFYEFLSPNFDSTKSGRIGNGTIDYHIFTLFFYIFFMIKQNKQICNGRRPASTMWAFTLVELIVVITILAILGTIAFISLQGYSAQARDSKRVSDIQNIKKSLELFSLNTGKYPKPDDYFTVSYGSQDLRYQGVVGDQVTTNLSRNLNEKPTDPLTESQYTYSSTYAGTEYEILGLYESNLISSNVGVNLVFSLPALATTKNYPKINGNYNGVYVKAGTYYLPTPSIINGNVWANTDISGDSTFLESQVITGGDNVLGVSTGGLNGITVNVFTGELDTTKGEDSNGNKALLAQAFIDTYSGTILASVGAYKEIVETESEGFISLVDDFVLNKDNFINSTTNNSSSNNTPSWQDEDPNCQIAIDVTITGTDLSGSPVTQIWAGCNSTLGTGLEYNETHDKSCRNYEGTYTSITGCDGASNELESSYTSHGVDNIYGKLYTWAEASKTDGTGPCPSGRSLPSQEQWTILLRNLGCSSSDYINATTTGWKCDGLGWKNHTDLDKNETNNLENALKIPLAGNNSTDGSTFQNRGYNTFFWSSTNFNSTYAWGIGIHRNTLGVSRDLFTKTIKFPVRCIKD